MRSGGLVQLEQSKVVLRKLIARLLNTYGRDLSIGALDSYERAPALGAGEVLGSARLLTKVSHLLGAWNSQEVRLEGFTEPLVLGSL